MECGRGVRPLAGASACAGASLTPRAVNTAVRQHCCPGSQCTTWWAHCVGACCSSGLDSSLGTSQVRDSTRRSNLGRASCSVHATHTHSATMRNRTAPCCAVVVAAQSCSTTSRSWCWASSRCRCCPSSWRCARAVHSRRAGSEARIAVTRLTPLCLSTVAVHAAPQVPPNPLPYPPPPQKNTQVLAARKAHGGESGGAAAGA